MVLFTNKGFIRNSKKAHLAKHILDEHQFDDVIPNIGKCRYVLDGGMLLQYWLQVGSTSKSRPDFYVCQPYGWQH